MPFACKTCKGAKFSVKPCTRCDGLGLHSCVCGNLNHPCVHCDGGGFEPCVGCGGSGWGRKGREKRGEKPVQPRGRKINETYLRRKQARMKWLVERPGVPFPPELEAVEEPGYVRNLAPYDLDSASADVKRYRADFIRILERHSYNISKVAKEMQMSRQAIYARIERFQVVIPERERLSRKPIAGVVG